MGTKDQLLKKAIETFQPFCDRKLTMEDAQEIVENITGFARVLIEWEEKERKQSSITPENELGSKKDSE
ncbi:hypothetical protein L0222_14320 [bacterium]|nr:hypothetical protein [bacterium]